jgi:hypothetical protein
LLYLESTTFVTGETLHVDGAFTAAASNSIHSRLSRHEDERLFSALAVVDSSSGSKSMLAERIHPGISRRRNHGD